MLLSGHVIHSSHVLTPSQSRFFKSLGKNISVPEKSVKNALESWAEKTGGLGHVSGHVILSANVEKPSLFTFSQNEWWW